VGTTGDMHSCCHLKTKLTEFNGKSNFNIKQESIKEFWESEYLHVLRKKFLNGERPKECQTCWKEESADILSLRQLSNRQYGIIGNKKPEEYLKILKKEKLEHPEDYNLDITNLCNLKCYMCDGTSSSKLLVENKDLGIENLDQKDYEYEEDKIDYLIEQIIKHKVTHLTLQGGEPLLNPKILKILQKLSTKDDAKKISVWITTNGTIQNQSILEILKCFEKIKLIFSVDGVGKINDYMRFPSDFRDIKNNIIKYKELENATFMINCVVQNFNLLNVEDMIEFARSLSIHLCLSPLESPAYLHCGVLPIGTKIKALENLEKIEKDKLIHVTNFDSLLNLIKASINDYDLGKIQLFKDMISKRDKYRKIYIKDYIPELSEDLNL
jgi:MoaA/NifB/PqqE/SkfB family radical SAM enzyme